MFESFIKKECEMKKYYAITTAVGPITLTESQGVITALSFTEQKAGHVYEETPLLGEAARQIEDYLKGERKEFDLPCRAQGTVFQEKIWTILKTIPYGERWTYKEVAQKAGNPRAARAVGMANHHNPLAIIIPCHRVVGSNGRLIGYAGGLAIKEALLKIESDHKNNDSHEKKALLKDVSI